jgi:hypothetical protein
MCIEPMSCMCTRGVSLMHMHAHKAAGPLPRHRLTLWLFACAPSPLRGGLTAPTRPLMKTPNKRERFSFEPFLIGRFAGLHRQLGADWALPSYQKRPPCRTFLNAEQFRLSLLRLGTLIRQTQIHDSSKWYRNCSLKRSPILAPCRRIRRYSGEPPTATWAFSWLLLSRNALGCPAPSGRA